MPVAKPTSHDAALEEAAPSRYVVGIDLGTTNSAVTFVDTERKQRPVEVFSVPQVVAAGEVEARETLPSFHYQPGKKEFAAGALRLPWQKASAEYVVGVFARDHGARVPGRMIASAKSWLSHSGVDRTAELLPWHPAEDVERLSPVEVSSRFLAHVRAAWDARFPDWPLAEQDIVLTLPASFDEVARELTIRAAAKAGLQRVVLIEEPQAAFYSWLEAHAADWEAHVEPGHKILVCDIGGGTSDFTLIRVRRDTQGEIQFHRVAVGEHLILGGDNLDLALAHHIEVKLTSGGKLPPRQWDVLVAACRHVKETLLGADPPEAYTVSLPGSGAKLVGGALQVEVTRDEVERVLVDGFLPFCELDEKPIARASGFQELGLPYAPDAAISRYLAAFLTAHRHITLDDEPEPADYDPARPDIVLFNGGLFESPLLRDRLLEVLRRWFPDKSGEVWEPVVLANRRLDLAVARGAAYYGLVRRGEGVRIAAELARTYYIGVASDPPAGVCLVPAGTVAGEEVEIPERQFELLLSQPVEFPLFVSSTRLTDKPGELIELDPEQMRSLPPIRTVIRARQKDTTDRISVTLHARLTEIGTLDLWCAEREGKRRWRMQFDVRSATQTDLAGHQGAAEREGFVDEATWQACYRELADTFGPESERKPQDLMKRLAAALDSPRDRWPTSLLRRIWETLMEMQDGRRPSIAHEARWLNLLGFSLRPGYGLALDDWRVAETWRNVQGKLVHGGPAPQAEARILWRRISGGLSSGQQRAIADPVLSPLRALHRRSKGGGGSGEASLKPQDTAEAWRLLGSLELLDTRTKIELGRMILELMDRRKMQPVRPAMIWALGRLGARVPLYGPLNTVVPTEAAGKWLSALIQSGGDDPMDQLAAMQLARRTDDRYRDLPEALRREAVAWLTAHDAPPHFLELVEQGGTLGQEEQGQVFGESLPRGLRLV